MKSAICTLYEGDYHYGVAVLANSLYAKGFRGTVWIGYRGPIPFWASPLIQHGRYQELKLNESLSLNFISLVTKLDLVFYKPTFMQELWECFCSECENLFYFDADIVNRAPWDFYERWVRRGVAICEDDWADFLPPNHPIRFAWMEYLEEKGFHQKRDLSRYYNAGFVGLPKAQSGILALWEKLIALFEKDGAYMRPGMEHTYPYINQMDQDVLNMALMVSNYPLTTVGQDGMDFHRRGFLMSHAAGGNVVKPWRKKLISQAFNGTPPSHVDKLFWNHTQFPIQVYKPGYLKLKKTSLAVAAAIGRIIRRS